MAQRSDAEVLQDIAGMVRSDAEVLRDIADRVRYMRKVMSSAPAPKFKLILSPVQVKRFIDCGLTEDLRALGVELPRK